MIVEFVRVPEGAQLADGRALKPYEQVVVAGTSLLMGGAPPADVILPGATGSNRLRLVGTTLAFEGARAPLQLGDCIGQAFATTDEAVWCRLATPGAPAMSWPSTAQFHALEQGRGTEALLVFHDALLEAGSPFASYFEPGTGAPPRQALADLQAVVDAGALTFDWRHGMAHAASLRATTRLQLHTIPQLGAHMLTHLTQALTISGSFVTRAAVDELLTLLSRSALPWLEHLRIENIEPSLTKSIRRLAEHPHWPRLTSLECEPPQRLTLIGHDGGRQALPFGGTDATVQLTREGLVHARGLCTTLVVNSPNGAPAHVFFNGRACWPTDGEPTFRAVLRAGDTFALGGRAYRVDTSA